MLHLLALDLRGGVDSPLAAAASRPRTAGRLAVVAILVDPAVWPWRGRVWAHLVSDVSYDELHVFAGRLGIPIEAFQGDHYDVPADQRQRALDLGAEAVGSRELVRRLRAAGLRRRRATRPST